jgi:hypothetical protein
VFFFDAEVVAKAEAKGSSPVDGLDTLIKASAQMEMNQDMAILTAHIPREENVLADLLSKGEINRFLEEIRRCGLESSSLSQINLRSPPYHIWPYSRPLF